MATPIPGLSRDSALAAGIPGEPAGFAYLAKKYGKLPLSVEPGAGHPAGARRVCALPAAARRHGVQEERIPEDARRHARVPGERRRCPNSATSSGSPSSPPASSCWPAKGADGFYKGAFAQKLVDGVRQLGGNWTLEDLANYKVVERPPVVGHYRGARIVSGSPPTSGGIALIDALNILDGFDLAQGRQGHAHASHRRGHAARASRSRRLSRRSGFRRPSRWRGSSTRTMPPGNALRSAWIAPRRAPCCRASTRRRPGRRPRISR